MTTDSKRRWFRFSMPIRFGVFGIVLWLAALCAALLVYPRLDNLAVGYPVFALGGLAALESLSGSPMSFAGVVLAETLSVFIVFSGIGAVVAFGTNRTK